MRLTPRTARRRAPSIFGIAIQDAILVVTYAYAQRQ